MLAGSLLLAITLAGFALWLQYREIGSWDEPPGGDASSAIRDLDQSYRRSRYRFRGWVHNTMLVTAGAIAVAGIAGPGRVWMACWLLATMLLFVVILLAAIDGVRTTRYQRRRLEQIRRETLPPPIAGHDVEPSATVSSSKS